MRLLVLGGTSWLGGAVAAEGVRRGHEVTCLARGESGAVPVGASLVQADRWKPGAYDGLGAFDAAVEVSWQPQLVASALASVRAEHWVYVSSISVYADTARASEGIAGDLLEPWEGSGPVDLTAYGEAKVACEHAYVSALPGERRVLARAGLIGGYGDRSDRLGYWPARIAMAAERPVVLAPPADYPTQVIDVLDLAAWLVRCAQDRVAGCFDAVGHPASLGELIDACTQVSGVTPTMAWRTSRDLDSAEVRPWMGEESLPLWMGLDDPDGMRRSPADALAAGLALRPLFDTVADAMRCERDLGLQRPRRSGLSPQREQQLLAGPPLM